MDDAEGPNPSTGALLYIALACCIVSVLASVAHIYGHLANFTERAQQLNIVRILLVVPIYGAYAAYSTWAMPSSRCCAVLCHETADVQPAMPS